MFEKITQSVQVVVDPTYVAEESDPRRSKYFFEYRVKITNQRSTKVQLISREWIITNAEGKIEKVEGEGVVGLQPVIEAGQTFEYSSFCPLTTPQGRMQGCYHMVTSNGENLKIEIPEFILSEPRLYH